MKKLFADEIFANSKIFEYQTTEENVDNKEAIEIIGNVPSGAKVEIKAIRITNAAANQRYNVLVSDGDVIKGPTVAGVGRSFTITRCVDLTITGNVKEGVKISSEGSITIDGNVAKGALVETSMGKIKAININGAKLTARDGITISGTAFGGSILESSMGEIKVASVDGDNINFTARDGIKIIDGTVPGSSVLKSSMGGIEASNIHGAKLTARDGITISGTAFGGSILESSMGGIEASNIHGAKLTARDDITISGTASGGSILESSMGNIKVNTAYKGVEFEFRKWNKLDIKNDRRSQEYLDSDIPNTGFTHVSSASAETSHSK